MVQYSVDSLPLKYWQCYVDSLQWGWMKVPNLSSLSDLILPWLSSLWRVTSFVAEFPLKFKRLCSNCVEIWWLYSNVPVLPRETRALSFHLVHGRISWLFSRSSCLSKWNSRVQLGDALHAHPSWNYLQIIYGCVSKVVPVICSYEIRKHEFHIFHMEWLICLTSWTNKHHYYKNRFDQSITP